MAGKKTAKKTNKPASPPPTAGVTPRMAAALAIVGEEVGKLDVAGDKKHGVYASVILEERNQDGTSQEVGIHEIPVPVVPYKFSRDAKTLARTAAIEAQREVTRRSLYGNREAIDGILNNFEGDFGIVQECLHAGSFKDAREIIAGQLLVVEALDALRVVLGLPEGQTSWEAE